MPPIAYKGGERERSRGGEHGQRWLMGAGMNQRTVYTEVWGKDTSVAGDRNKRKTKGIDRPS